MAEFVFTPLEAPTPSIPTDPERAAVIREIMRQLVKTGGRA